MNTAATTWLATLALAGLMSRSSLAQQKAAPPSVAVPAPASPVRVPAPVPAPLPARGPAAAPAEDGDEAASYRLRDLSPVARKRDYDGALVRVRQRAQRHEVARNAGESKWRRGVDNVAVDSMTQRPVGINVFVIRY